MMKSADKQGDMKLTPFPQILKDFAYLQNVNRNFVRYL